MNYGNVKVARFRGRQKSAAERTDHDVNLELPAERIALADRFAEEARILDHSVEMASITLIVQEFALHPDEAALDLEFEVAAPLGASADAPSTGPLQLPPPPAPAVEGDGRVGVHQCGEDEANLLGPHVVPREGAQLGEQAPVGLRQLLLHSHVQSPQD